MKTDIQKHHYLTYAVYIALLLMSATLGAVCAFKIGRILSLFGYVIGALMPLIAGAVIAYLLTPVVHFFESKVFSSLKNRGKIRLCRTVSVCFVYMLLFVCAGLVLFLLLPQLFSNYAELASHAEEYIRFAKEFADEFIESSDFFGENSTLADLLGGVELEQFLGGIIVDSFLLADRFVSGVITLAGRLIDIFMAGVYALICAFGILLYADKLSQFALRIASAFLSEKQLGAVFSMLHSLDRAFGGFFFGRIIESLMIGGLGLAVFYLVGMPYPPLLSIIICFFNLIPYFGSFFAAVVGGVIVFVADPSMLLWFIIVDLLLEQIDANILAPRVIGTSVGIHPLFIILSITVMGSIFGIVGLVIGVPVASVLIDAVRYLCKKREERGIA